MHANLYTEKNRIKSHGMLSLWDQVFTVFLFARARETFDLILFDWIGRFSAVSVIVSKQMDSKRLSLLYLFVHKRATFHSKLNVINVIIRFLHLQPIVLLWRRCCRVAAEKNHGASLRWKCCDYGIYMKCTQMWINYNYDYNDEEQLAWADFKQKIVVVKCAIYQEVIKSESRRWHYTINQFIASNGWLFDQLT